MKNKTLLFAACVLVPSALLADHIDSVVINASASKAYVAQKFAKGVPQPESYGFYEGKYFEGDTHDPSISNAIFLDIAKILAPDLARQNYFPAKDAKKADLLIVIDWGRTAIDPNGKKSDSETSFELKNESSDVSSYNSSVAAYKGARMVGGIANSVPDPRNVTMDLMTDQANAMSAQKFTEFNATLLGYTATLQKAMATQWASSNGLGSVAEARLTELNEPRYFVALLAYDYQKLRNGTSAGGAKSAPQPVWSVRFNASADNNNFMKALPAMSRIAASYFGRQLDELKIEPLSLAKN